MQFALPVFESPEALAAQNNDETDLYLGAWLQFPLSGRYPLASRAASTNCK
jgi:hypothetical protein